MSYEYDENGNVIKTTYDDSTFVTTSYDDFGRKLTETNQIGLTRTFTYNDDGRLIGVTLPPAQTGDPAPVYAYQYDEWGNQTLLVDPLGRETRFTYDDQGRQLTRTLPLGFGDDGIANTADDPQNSDDWTENFEYDTRGRQSLHVSFEGKVTQFVYDDTTDGRLIEKQFFDNLGQFNNGQGTPSETVTYTYDTFGRVLTVSQADSQGSPVRTVSNTYDIQGRLTQVASPEGILVYTYDDLGRKTSTQVYAATADPAVDTADRVTSFTYDALGRLQTVTEDADLTITGDELTTSYFYDLVGNLDATLLPNDVLEDYIYDDLNRLDLLIHYTTDGTAADLADLTDNNQLALFDYAVRDDGKRTALSESLSTSSGFVTNDYTWTYDDLGRLTREVIDSSDNARDITVDYSYDILGNRLTKTVDKGSDGTIEETITNTFDANDRQLTSEKDTDGLAGAEESTTYDYDHTQQTGKTETKADGTKIITTNSFDLQGRMATVTIENRDSSDILTSKTVNTYEYDSSGIRVSILEEKDTDGDGTYDSRKRTESLVDHRNFTGYQQTIRETEYDADTNNITKQTDYTFGHDEISQHVMEYDAQGAITSNVTHVFGHDGHGSVRVLFDAAAVVVQLFVYDAYGIMHAIYDGAGNFFSADAKDALTNLLYSGEKTDSTGLQYLRARYYNPNTGRFNRLDPFFGNHSDPQSFHKYLYTHADPVNGIDPTGMLSVRVAIALGVAPTIGAGVWTYQYNSYGRNYTYSRGGSTVTSAQLRTEYINSIGNIRDAYYNTNPDIFMAMNLDGIFDQALKDAPHVKRVIYESVPTRAAAYDSYWNALLIDDLDGFLNIPNDFSTPGSKVGALSTIIHETVHVTNDIRGREGGVWADEGDAYTVQFYLDAFLKLASFAKASNSNFPDTRIDAYQEFWNNYENGRFDQMGHKIYKHSGSSKPMTYSHLQQVENFYGVSLEKSSVEPFIPYYPDQ